jgi:hypothetical protein
VEDNSTGDEGSHSIAPHGHTEGNAVSDTQKAEVLAESLEAVSAGKQTIGTGSH